MSQGQTKTSGQYDIVFEGANRQSTALIVLCKKYSLANILEKDFGVSFDGAIKGNRDIKKIGKITVYGKAANVEKVKQAFEILTTYYDEGTHFSKEILEDITGQINAKGSYARTQFKTAANQNSRGGNKPGTYTFEARTQAQADLWNTIESQTLTFGVGPAGTGKTHVAVARAVQALKSGEVKKIMLARPAIGTGKDLGALPGGVEDKLAPYMRPLYDELNEVLGPTQLKAYITSGTIEIAPVEMMRGRTFKNAFVIVDEAQNCTKEQMRMALTRIGEDSKMVVTGDPMQTDLKDKSDSGLKWAYEKLDGKPSIGVQYFSPADVVRHEVVKTIVEALDDDNQANPGATRKVAAAPAPRQQRKAPGQG